MSKCMLIFWSSLLVLNILFVGFVIQFDYHSFHSENSFLENLQALTLFFGAIGYFISSQSLVANKSLF